MTLYDFEHQLAQGEAGEAQIDEFFASWYRITKAGHDQQRRGIDRIWIDRQTGRTFTVEYKTDWTAARTGNAFVETISNDSSHSPGWGYKSRATWLVYFIPDPETLYVLEMAHIRQNLPRWEEAYETRAVMNRGYLTHGVLVPLDEFEQLAVAVF